MKICMVTDCDRKNYAKGLCHKHYQRYWRYGDISKVFTRNYRRGESHPPYKHIVKSESGFKTILTREITVRGLIG